MVFLALQWKMRDPLMLQQGFQGTSHVSSWESGILSGCEGKLGTPFKSVQRNPASPHLELKQETRGSPRVVTGTSGNLSCCLKGVRPLFKMRGGTLDCSRVIAEELGVISF